MKYFFPKTSQVQSKVMCINNEYKSQVLNNESHDIYFYRLLIRIVAMCQQCLTKPQDSLVLSFIK